MWRVLTTVMILACLPTMADAQFRPTSVPVTSMSRPEQPEEGPKFTNLLSAVGFIDSALPRNTVRTRLDFDYGDNRPTRASYLYSKNGFLLPERNVDSQTLDTYVEYAVGSWFSLFLQQPLRWTNPDFNANESGVGNINVGLKFAFIDTESFLTTFQFRATAPTASDRSLESRIWALEPALLMNFQPLPYLTIEGEARYWIPLADRSYSGDVARYGIGVGYGQRGGSDIWMIPVAELVGWTVMNGQVEVVEPMAIDVQGASGQTILNGALGVRMGLGANLEFYGGYTRALTGTRWYRDMVRFEFRWLY